MSVRCITWAWDQARADRVSRGELLTLVALADQADDDGHGFCRLAIICSMTNQSDKTVRRACRRLEDLGLLERRRRRRRDGSWGVHDYWLPVHQQSLLGPDHQRSNGTTGHFDRWRDSEPADPAESRVVAAFPADDAEHNHRSNGTTGQNDRWPEMTGGPPVTGDRTSPVSYCPDPPTCACAREGGLPAGHELFVAFATGPRPDDLLTYCTADVENLRETFPELTGAQVRAVLREIGAWYRGECQDPDNPHGRKARLPHDWKRMVRKWMGEARDKAAAGVAPAKKAAGSDIARSFEGVVYEGDDHDPNWLKED